MRVAVLGSGSRGNAIALTADDDTLLIDAGFSLKELTRRAGEIGLDLGGVRAVLLTHEHGDHTRGAGALARRVGCPIVASAGTLAAVRPRIGTVEVSVVDHHRERPVGPFRVTAGRTSHDAAEPMAFSVRRPGTNQRVAVAYDVGTPTTGLRYLLRNATCLVLEANHDDVLLRTSNYPASVRARIAGPGGHLSNRAAGELLAEVCHAELSTVVLAHLSDRCNRADLARAAAEAALASQGFAGQLVVAEQDRPIGPIELRPPQSALEV
jgi:phosphoribosyl 1,2-cyclic phosphodiesterase